MIRNATEAQAKGKEMIDIYSRERNEGKTNMWELKGNKQQNYEDLNIRKNKVRKAINP